MLYSELQRHFACIEKGVPSDVVLPKLPSDRGIGFRASMNYSDLQKRFNLISGK